MFQRCLLIIGDEPENLKSFQIRITEYKKIIDEVSNVNGKSITHRVKFEYIHREKYTIINAEFCEKFKIRALSLFKVAKTLADGCGVVVSRFARFNAADIAEIDEDLAYWYGNGTK